MRIDVTIHVNPNQQIYLPLYPNVEENDIEDYVDKIVKSFYGSVFFTFRAVKNAD